MDRISLTSQRSPVRNQKILSVADFIVKYLRNEKSCERVKEVNIQKIIYFSRLIWISELKKDIIQAEFKARKMWPVNELLYDSYKKYIEHGKPLWSSYPLSVEERTIFEYCADKFNNLGSGEISDYSHQDPERIDKKAIKWKMNEQTSAQRFSPKIKTLFDDYFPYAIKEAQIIDQHLSDLDIK